MSNMIDILNAIDRQANVLENEANSLAKNLDYSKLAEFPAEDARLLREAAELLFQHWQKL